MDCPPIPNLHVCFNILLKSKIYLKECPPSAKYMYTLLYIAAHKKDTYFCSFKHNSKIYIQPLQFN